MPQKMPFTKRWEKELIQESGKSVAKEFITRIQNKYDEICQRHGAVEDPVLREHLHGNIFPHIAAYQVFLEAEKGPETGRKEKALAKVLKLHFLTLKEKRRQFETIGKMSFGFPIFRRVVRSRIKHEHPSTGWNIDWLEYNKDCVAMKVNSCFYNEVCKDYDIPELINIFCKGDDYVFAEPDTPYIEWGRKHSIAIGNDYCDVIYYRKSKK